MSGFDLLFDFDGPRHGLAAPRWPRKRASGRSPEIRGARSYEHVSPDGTTTLIFGNVSQRRSAAGDATMGHEQIDNIVRGDLIRLTEEAAGDYVAFRIAPDKGDVQVYRCPSGSARCFYHRHGSSLRVTSAFDGIGVMAPGALGLNLKFLSHHCAFGRMVSHETGLEGLEEVTPGVVYKFGKHGLDKQRLWRPEVFAADTDAALTPAGLRAAVLDAVRASIHGTDLHLVSLSGGLDSSVLIAALAQVVDVKRLVAVNFRDRSDVSDERRFALDVCKRFGVQLETVTLDGFGTSLEHLMSTPQDVRPTPYLLAQGFNSLLGEIATSHGAQAYFTGSGGDSVFFSEKTPLVAADAVRSRSLRATARALKHTRELTGVPLRRALQTVCSHGLGRRAYDPYASVHLEGRCLSAAAQASLSRPYLASEWVREGRGLPAGKILHLAMLADTLHYQNLLRGPSGLQEINPFISQPLFERVLATPTYELVPGAEDRGMLRSAFAGDLPQSVLTRRRKGSAGAFCSDVYTANAGGLRDILLEGALVQQEILDLSALQRAIAAASSGSERSQMMLLEHACTEIWVRSALSGRRTVHRAALCESADSLHEDN